MMVRRQGLVLPGVCYSQPQYIASYLRRSEDHFLRYPAHNCDDQIEQR